MVFASSHFDDPAARAAQFLRRLAFIILMIIAPVAEVASHGLIYIWLPVGAAILVMAGVIEGWDEAPRRLLAAALSPIGMASVFLAFWAALSLIWTPFPGEAWPRLGRTLLTAGIAFVAIVSLPQRSKISNIYLLPIGVVITAAATTAMIALGPDWFWKGPNPDYTLAQRCIMSMAILLWPALGALALRERVLLAASLAIMSAAAALSAFEPIALIALIAGALVYAGAMTRPMRLARALAYGLAILVLGAPLFVAALYPFVALAHKAYAAPVLVFSDLVVHQWPRFITGHGLDMARRAVAIGFLPANAPHSIVFTLWYDLGVVGVAGFVFLMTAAFLASGELGTHVAPAVLAALAAGLVIAVLGAETMQLWWMTVNGIAAIALAHLARAHPRSKRPPAPAADHESDQERD